MDNKELREIMREELIANYAIVNKGLEDVEKRLDHHSEHGCTYGQVTRTRSNTVVSVFLFLAAVVGLIRIIIEVI